jgi:hypothetical protein
MLARSSIFLWLGQNKKFSDQYRLAKQAQIDDLLHENLEIDADDSPNDWVDRQGKDGQTGRVVNRDNIRRAKLRIAA